ncbi:lysoplasmalogenase family protein [Kordia zhangzhouensis]|uniref:lysoplasmalogenase family protein n=1 Tax=Kordia zhangzhouensis TaxID=1620405 RepID=UPI0006293223|nr:lysoplasmalogenase family protein [Kordia zhangzhouensis]
MNKQTIVTYIYFFIMLLDVLGVFFPEVIQRRYTTFFPIPVLFLLYMVSVEKLNVYYSLALLSTFLGVVFFNIEAYFKLGLICYAMGVFLYIIITLRYVSIISTKSIFYATIPFLIVYLVPLMLYSHAVQGEIFNHIMLYVFCVGFFFLLGTLVYINQPNRSNLWLLYSGILFVISTIIHGYNMFFGYVALLQAGVITTFLLMHFAMYKHMTMEEV